MPGTGTDLSTLLCNGRGAKREGKEKKNTEGRRYTTEQHPRRKKRLWEAEQGRERQGESALTAGSCSIEDWHAIHHYVTFKQH